MTCRRCGTDGHMQGCTVNDPVYPSDKTWPVTPSQREEWAGFNEGVRRLQRKRGTLQEMPR
jgi:hypothetical protein